MSEASLHAITKEENRYSISRPIIIREVIIIEKKPTLLDSIPTMAMLVVYALILQTIFSIWEGINKKSCRFVQFVLLCIFPPFFFFAIGSLIFPISWLVYIAGNLFILYNIFKKPMSGDVPSMVYTIFKVLFISTNIGIFTSQALLFICFFLSLEKYVSIFFKVLIFFLYFGLMSREIINILSEVMASNTGFYSKEGVPGRGNNNMLCMICTNQFDTSSSDVIHTLICGHSFHSNCIKGWCIIGKKGFCPYCKKGVDYNTIPSELWHKTEMWFYPLLTALRGFIVFAMSMVILLFYREIMGGLNEDD